MTDLEPHSLLVLHLLLLLLLLFLLYHHPVNFSLSPPPPLLFPSLSPPFSPPPPSPHQVERPLLEKASLPKSPEDVADLPPELIVKASSCLGLELTLSKTSIALIMQLLKVT